MSLTRAKEYLKKFELDDKVMEFPVSSATVEEAAKALICEEKEIVWRELSERAPSGNPRIPNKSVYILPGLRFCAEALFRPWSRLHQEIPACIQ